MKYAAASILVLVFLSGSCSSYRSARLREEGEAIVAKIDTFKGKNQRLPESLSEIGITEKEEGPIYYQKTSDSKYVVWYGAGVGESVTFDSDTRRWTP